MFCPLTKTIPKYLDLSYKTDLDFLGLFKEGKHLIIDLVQLSSISRFILEVTRHLPYFFSDKTELFSFKNNPKNLDPSYKMDLDLWDCLGRILLVL